MRALRARKIGFPGFGTKIISSPVRARECNALTSPNQADKDYKSYDVERRSLPKSWTAQIDVR